MTRLPLRTKLFLSILAILAISFAVLFGFTLHSIDSFVSAEIDRTLTQGVSFVRRELSERNELIVRSLLQPASAHPVQERIVRRDIRWLDDAMNRWLEQLPAVDRLLVFDDGDRVVTQTGRPPAPTGLHVLLPLVRRSRESADPVISTELVYCPGDDPSVNPGDSDGRFLLASVVAIPVRSAGASPIATIVAVDIIHDDVDFIEGLLPVLGSDSVIGISQQGETITGTSPLAEGHLPAEVLRQLEQGGNVPWGSIREGRRYRSVSSPLFNNRNELVGALTFSLSEEKFRELARTNRRNISVAFLLGTVLSFLAAYLIARRLTHPLIKLTDGVQRIESGDYHGRVDVEGADEIAGVAEAFNRMSEALEERNRTIESKAAMLVDLNEQLERRVAERSRQLADRTALQEEIIGVVTDGVMVVNAEGRVILMNRSAQALLGVETDDPLPRFDAICSRGGFCDLGDAIDEVRKGRERRRKKLQSATTVIEADLAPIIRDGNVETVVVSLHDVTVQESIDRMKSDFISTVSHELKTPLTSIRGALQFILSKSRWLTGTERELLEICSRNTERLIRLITGILDISRIEQGTVPFDFRPLAPADIVMHAADELRGMALERNVHLVTLVDPDLPPVTGDHDRLVQVLTNLLSNAINFSDEGKVVRIFARSDGEMVVFTVQDMNRTIPEGERHKLFRKFQQIDQGEGGRLGGTGLGLAISREIVERHGGRIWHEPQFAGGNEFSFAIPKGETS